MTDPIRLLEITETPLDVSRVYDAVQDPAAGGISLFVGTVRDRDAGKEVTGLGYSAHPTAMTTFHDVVHEVVSAHDVLAVAAAHRIGGLVVGDVAVVVAVSCPHRGDAFVTCRALIDALKSRVPIWKHQVFTDGSEEWVGTP